MAALSILVLIAIAMAITTGDPPVLGVGVWSLVLCAASIGAFEAVSALLGAMLTGVFLVGLLERRNPTIMRMGSDSLAVMLLFAGGVVILYIIH
ncbi:MAG TPA: hypothetical protein VF200_04450 [Woeseiaceae bacterium]